MKTFSLSLDKKNLAFYVINQMNNMFPDNKKIDTLLFTKYLGKALERTEYCFSKVNNRYFTNNEYIFFNHLNGDQYSMFLYFLSNTLYKNDYDLSICAKVFLLNKSLFSVDAFYEVELPDIFLFVHPLGTVMGRGNYSDYMIIYQRCNIGSNLDIYPTFEKYVTLHPGSAVLGDCRIGENCRIGAHSLILDSDLKPNTTYIGNPKDYKLLPNVSKNKIWL
jgi:serine O-acetyltransferase